MRIVYDHDEVDLTTYAILSDSKTGLFFDAEALAIVANDDLTTPEIELVENIVNPGQYETELECALPDGVYYVSIWSQDGENPDRTADTKIGTGVVNFRNGVQVFSY